MPKKIQRVVILAAGRGTRFSPITSILPKEMFPVVDKPVIQYVLEEVIVPGIEEVVLVINEKKSILRDYIERTESNEFRQLLSGVKIKIVYQEEGSYGSGTALLSAEKYIDDGPFGVFFADSFGLRNHSRVQSMVKEYETNRIPVISIIPITKDQLNTYGIPLVKKQTGDTIVIGGFVEKPGIDFDGPLLAAPNGYFLGPEIFHYLHKLQPDQWGEISLPEAIGGYSKQNIVSGLIFRGPFFEVGNRADYVKSKLKMVLFRDDLGELRLGIRNFVKELIRNPLSGQAE